jgi:TIR domain-containing protein
LKSAPASLLPSEAFVSHSSADRAFVERLAIELQRHGVPYWYSRRNILGAQQWHDEIGQALTRCDWFVLMLSPNSVKSQWVKHELVFALNEKRYENRIIPCVVRKCDVNKLSWTLPSFQFIDFSKSFEQGVRALLKVWSIGYQPPPPAGRSTRPAKRKSRRRS